VEPLSEKERIYNMPGLVVFPSLAAALRAGYQIFDRTSDGYVVRTKTAAGWGYGVGQMHVTELSTPGATCARGTASVVNSPLLDSLAQCDRPYRVHFLRGTRCVYFVRSAKHIYRSVARSRMRRMRRGGHLRGVASRARKSRRIQFTPMRYPHRFSHVRIEDHYLRCPPARDTYALVNRRSVEH
jgi:hypothetical protein